MKIEISNTKDKIIEQYYTLVNPLLGKNKLTPMEIKILSKLYLVYDSYKHLGEDVANSLVFHVNTRNKITETISKELKIKLSYNNYHGVLKVLRSKQVITFNSILYKCPIKDNKIDISIGLTILPNEE